MNNSFKIILLLVFITSCKHEIKQEVTKPIEMPFRVGLDTILEPNDPKHLDLSKHQLYIDTTRTSEIYNELMNWKLDRKDNDVLSSFEKEITKNHNFIKIDLKSFPKYWIGLKKLHNEFVIYDPCDGNIEAIQIEESSVLFCNQLEPDIGMISRLIRIKSHEIELELSKVFQKTKSQKVMLTIKPTEFENLYSLTYGNVKRYVTPSNKVNEFDMVVNHCPKMKRSEFNGFDK